MHGTVRVLRIRRKKIDHILSYVLFQDMLEMVFGQSLRNAMSPTMIISEPPLFYPQWGIAILHILGYNDKYIKRIYKHSYKIRSLS